ncbi:ABC transporter permease [Actinomadura graeca]|uniref:ABC transporter permease n=1 Tax=Actinomadura graeca TaxID=2750812 RepID=A0ABX8QR01_9ACTN|nr:ABC transporter permease [Actinomadura graeca]QXJ21090.1 ABC transporter permease [Actinomadura graeca]
MTGTRLLRLVGLLYILVVAGYLLVPSVLVTVMSFGKGELLRFPPELFSLRWYDEFLGSADWRDAAVRSILVGLGAAGLSAVLGTAAAIAVVRGQLPLRRVFAALAISPMVVPPVVIAVGGYKTFDRFHLIGSLPGLVLVHTVFGVPVVMLLVTASLLRLDDRLELASTSLGAGMWTTYRRITLPLIAPAILSGALFAFLTSFDELVVAVFLIGAAGSTLPMKIFSEITFGLSPVVAAISALLLLLTAVILGAAGAVRGGPESATTAAQAQRKELV